MSNLEIKTGLNTMLNFLAEEEQKPRRCKRFFEIIHQIRVAIAIINELLKRIENLENEINNLKIK